MKPKLPSAKSHPSASPKTPYLNFGDPAPTPHPESAATSKPLRLVAYIDGGSRGNPGLAGYGVHMVDADARPVKDIYGFLGVRTNNYAEYSALLAALRFAVRARCADLQVFSDSELLVRQLNGVYKVRHPEIRKLYDEAQHLIRRLDRFAIQHVYRDANKEADRLANHAMDARASSEDP